MTDNPAILSDGHLGLLDPVNSVVSGPRTGFKWKLATCPPSMLAPFNGVCGFDSGQPFTGTLFRFPLRSQALIEARKSTVTGGKSRVGQRVSTLPYTAESIWKLFDIIRQEGGHLLLFLRNISSVSLEEISSSGSASNPTLHYRVTVDAITPIPRELRCAVPFEAYPAGIKGVDAKLQTQLQALQDGGRGAVYRFLKGLGGDAGDASSKASPRQLCELLGQLDQDPFSSFELTVVVHDNRVAADARCRWLVVELLGRGHAAHVGASDATQRHAHIRLVPWGAVAAPIDSVLEPGQGSVFCMLPLPRNISLPVPLHVNSLFELDDSRSSIALEPDGSFQANANVTHFSHDQLKKYWNALLLVCVVAPAWAQLIHIAASLKMRGSTACSMTALRGLFPTRALVPDCWHPLVNAFYELAVVSPPSSVSLRLFHSDVKGGQLLSFEEAVFIATHGSGEIDSLPAQASSALCALGLPTVLVPPHIFGELQQAATADIKLLSRDRIKPLLQPAAVALLAPVDRQSLLELVLSENFRVPASALLGMPLLAVRSPELEGPAFVSFARDSSMTSESAVTNVVFCSVSDVELSVFFEPFDALDHVAFPIRCLEAPLEGTQLQSFSLGQAARWLVAQSGSTADQRSLSSAWLVQLWTWLRALPDSRDLQLFLDSCAGAQSVCLVPLCLCAHQVLTRARKCPSSVLLAASLCDPVVVAPATDAETPEVLAVLRHLGVAISCSPQPSRPCWADFPNPQDVYDLLHGVDGRAGRQVWKKPCSPDSILVALEELSSHNLPPLDEVSAMLLYKYFVCDRQRRVGDPKSVASLPVFESLAPATFRPLQLGGAKIISRELAVAARGLFADDGSHATSWVWSNHVFVSCGDLSCSEERAFFKCVNVAVLDNMDGIIEIVAPQLRKVGCIRRAAATHLVQLMDLLLPFRLDDSRLKLLKEARLLLSAAEDESDKEMLTLSAASELLEPSSESEALCRVLPSARAQSLLPSLRGHEHRDLLLRLGLRPEPSLPELAEVARHIAQLPESDGAQLQSKRVAATQLLAHLSRRCTLPGLGGGAGLITHENLQGCGLLEPPWLPTLAQVAFPLSFLPQPPSGIPAFSCPSKMESCSLLEFVSATLPVLDTLPLEPLPVMLEHALGWGKPVSPETTWLQVATFAAQHAAAPNASTGVYATPHAEQSLPEISKWFHKIFRELHKRWEEARKTGKSLATPDGGWLVWTGARLLPAGCVAFKAAWAEDAEEGMLLSSHFGCPSELLKHEQPLRELLLDMGVGEHHRGERLLDLVNKVQLQRAAAPGFQSPGPELTAIELQFCVTACKYGVQLVLQAGSGSSGRDQAGPMFVPTKCKHLVAASDCVFSDGSDQRLLLPFLNERKPDWPSYVLHDELSHADWAEKVLGVRRLATLFLGSRTGPSLGVRFFQKEEFCERLHNTLAQYPDGRAIPVELLQNADDAGARVFRMCIDRTSHGADGLIDTRLKEWQGPAILVYNDGNEFSENDFNGLSTFGTGSKGRKQATAKIGRFGLGFSCVYNITDVPMILSGKHLVVLDPLKRFVPEEGGVQIDFIANKLALHFRAQLEPFCVGQDFAPIDIGRAGASDEAKAVRGTVFRLPLRTAEQAKASNIASNQDAYSDARVNDLCDALRTEAVSLLLFTQNIEAIELFEYVNVPGSGPSGVSKELRRVFSASLDIPPPTRTLRSQLWERLRIARNEKKQQMLPLAKPDVFELRVRIEEQGKEIRHEMWVVSNMLAKTLIGTQEAELATEGRLCWGGVAAPLPMDRPVDNVPGLQAVPGGGRLFCFTPLPQASSSVPVHVNGFFAVDSGRLAIVVGEDSTDQRQRTKWNSDVLELAVGPAYAGLIDYLVHTKKWAPAASFGLWPDALGLQHSQPLPKDYDKSFVLPVMAALRRGFYSEIIKLRPVLPSVHDKKPISPAKCQYLDPSLLTLIDVLRLVRDESANQIALSFPPRLPDLLSLFAKTPKPLEISTVSKQTFFEKFVFACIDKGLLPLARVEELMVSLLQALTSKRDPDHAMAQSLLVKMKSLKFLPVATHSGAPAAQHHSTKLQNVSSLFDPRCPAAKHFLPEEEEFPALSFREAELLDNLKKHLGLKTSLTAADICGRIRVLSRDYAISVARHMDIYHEICNYNGLDLNIPAEIQWLPAKRRPLEHDWPSVLPWAGDAEAGRLFSTTEIYASTEQELVGTVRPVATFPSSNRVALRKATAGDVLEQLRHLCDVVTGANASGEGDHCQAQRDSHTVIPSSVVSKLTDKLYEFLCAHGEDEVQQLGATERWVWVSAAETFVAPCYVAYSSLKPGLDVLRPYLYAIPDPPSYYETAAGKLKTLLTSTLRPAVSSAGFTAAQLVRLLSRVRDDYDGQLSRANLKLCVDTLEQLVNSEGYATVPRADILVPVKMVETDDVCCLRPLDDTMRDNSPSPHILHNAIAQTNRAVLHPAVSAALADHLNVATVRDLVSDLGVEEFGDSEPFGQQTEPVDVRIKNILRDYPMEGTTLLRELIQNADDAEATVMKVVLDCKTHGSDFLPFPGLKALQGPALLVYNNKPFSPDDWKHIQRIGRSGKMASETTIGKFGLGFNVVYHTTDVPSIISGSRIVFFDPLIKHVPLATREHPGYSHKKCGELASVNTDLLPPYRLDVLIGAPITPIDVSWELDGTILRLPLRVESPYHSSATQKKTEGLAAPKSVADIKELLRIFQAEAHHALLFVKHLQRIEVRILADGLGGVADYVVTVDRAPAPVLPEGVAFTNDAERRYTSLQIRTSVSHPSSVSMHKEALWHVVHAEVPPEANTSTSTNTSTKTSSGAVAACISSNRASSILTQGLAFCFLQLPLATQLPVHVHGSFQLTSNRRSLYGTEPGEGQSDSPNVHLLTQVVAYAYARLLCECTAYVASPVASPSMQPAGAPIRESLDWYYSLFPKGSKIKGLWENLSTELFRLLHQYPAAVLFRSGPHSQACEWPGSRWLIPRDVLAVELQADSWAKPTEQWREAPHLPHAMNSPPLQALCTLSTLPISLLPPHVYGGFRGPAALSPMEPAAARSRLRACADAQAKPGVDGRWPLQQSLEPALRSKDHVIALLQYCCEDIRCVHCEREKRKKVAKSGPASVKMDRVARRSAAATVLPPTSVPCETVDCARDLPLLLYESEELGCVGASSGWCYDPCLVRLLSERKAHFLNEEVSKIITKIQHGCSHGGPLWSDLGIQHATLALVAQNMDGTGLPCDRLDVTTNGGCSAVMLTGHEAGKVQGWIEEFWTVVDHQLSACKSAQEHLSEMRNLLKPFAKYALLACEPMPGIARAFPHAASDAAELCLVSPLSLFTSEAGYHDSTPIPLALLEHSSFKNISSTLTGLGVPILRKLVKQEPKYFGDSESVVYEYRKCIEQAHGGTSSPHCTVLEAIGAACAARRVDVQAAFDQLPVALRKNMLSWISESPMHIFCSSVERSREAMRVLRAVPLFIIWSASSDSLENVKPGDYLAAGANCKPTHPLVALDTKYWDVNSTVGSTSGGIAGTSLNAWDRCVIAAFVKLAGRWEPLDLRPLLKLLDVPVKSWQDFYQHAVLPKLTSLAPDERYMHVRHMTALAAQLPGLSSTSLLECLKKTPFISAGSGFQQASHYFSRKNPLFVLLLSEEHFLPADVPRDDHFVQQLERLGLLTNLSTARALRMTISAFHSQHEPRRLEPVLQEVASTALKLLDALDDFAIQHSPGTAESQSCAELLKFCAGLCFVPAAPPPPWVVTARDILQNSGRTPIPVLAPRATLVSPQDCVTTTAEYEKQLARLTWSQLASIKRPSYPLYTAPRRVQTSLGFALFDRNEHGLKLLAAHALAVAVCYQALYGCVPEPMLEISAVLQTIRDEFDDALAFLNLRESLAVLRQAEGLRAHLADSPLFPVQSAFAGGVVLVRARDLFLEHLPSDQQPTSVEFPGIHYVPPELMFVRDLLQLLGCGSLPGPAHIVQSTLRIKEKSQDSPANPNMVKTMGALLACLGSMLARSPAEDVLQNLDLSECQLLDTNHVLRSAKLLVIDDLYPSRSINLPGLSDSICRVLANRMVYPSLTCQSSDEVVTLFVRLSLARRLSSLVEERQDGPVVDVEESPPLHKAFNALAIALVSDEFSASLLRLCVTAAGASCMSSAVLQRSVARVSRWTFRLVTLDSIRMKWFDRETNELVSDSETQTKTASRQTPDFSARFVALSKAVARLSRDPANPNEVLIGGLNASNDSEATGFLQSSKLLAELISSFILEDTGINITSHIMLLWELLMQPPESMIEQLNFREIPPLPQENLADGSTVFPVHRVKLWQESALLTASPFTLNETVAYHPRIEMGTQASVVADDELLIYATVIKDLGVDPIHGFRCVRLRIGPESIVDVLSVHIFRFPSEQVGFAEMAALPLALDASSDGSPAVCAAPPHEPEDYVTVLAKLRAELRQILRLPDKDQPAAFRRLYLAHHPDKNKFGLTSEQATELFRMIRKTSVEGVLPPSDAADSNADATTSAQGRARTTGGFDWAHFSQQWEQQGYWHAHNSHQRRGRGRGRRGPSGGGGGWGGGNGGYGNGGGGGPHRRRAAGPRWGFTSTPHPASPPPRSASQTPDSGPGLLPAEAFRQAAQEMQQAARSVLGNARLAGPACVLAHQAAEQALMAALMACGHQPTTESMPLPSLLARLAAARPDPALAAPALAEDVTALGTHTRAARYPQPGLRVDGAAGAAAVDAAERLLAACGGTGCQPGSAPGCVD